MLPDSDFVLWGNGSHNISEIPKIIWTFWDAPSPSPLVDICFGQIRSILPDYQFHIITKKNISEFLPEIPVPRTDISFINFTDLVRLKLLQKFGGVYLDASVLLTENLDWVHELRRETAAEMVGFYTDKFTTDIHFPLVETWCIATPEHSKFISDWADEFSKCYASDSPHHYFDEDKKNPEFLQGITDEGSNYLIAYLAASRCMRKNADYRLALLPALETAHRYTWGKLAPRLEEFADFFLTKPVTHNPPSLIKFMNNRRTLIDRQIRQGRYKRDSLLFHKLKGYKYFDFIYHKNLRYAKFIINNILEKF